MRLLEYSQYILGKMAFDQRLFAKEYRKLTQNLSVAEARQLHTWVRKHYKEISLS